MLPANKKNTATTTLYLLATAANSVDVINQFYDRTWLELKGLDTAAAGTSAGLPGPFPPLMTLVAHNVIHHTFNQNGTTIVPTAERLEDESARLRLETTLSKNINSLNQNLAAAVTHVETYLHDTLHYVAGP